MKFQAITLLSILALSTATPLPTQCPGILSIISLFTADKCSNSDNFWAQSTGADTYLSLKKKDGCQAINAAWDISSLRLGFLYEKCSFTAYTDAECKEGGVTLPVEACVTSQGSGWKSLALRGCDREE